MTTAAEVAIQSCVNGWIHLKYDAPNVHLTARDVAKVHLRRRIGRKYRAAEDVFRASEDVLNAGLLGLILESVERIAESTVDRRTLISERLAEHRDWLIFTRPVLVEWIEVAERDWQKLSGKYDVESVKRFLSWDQLVTDVMRSSAHQCRRDLFKDRCDELNAAVARNDIEAFNSIGPVNAARFIR